MYDSQTLSEGGMDFKFWTTLNMGIYRGFNIRSCGLFNFHPIRLHNYL
jgi:hypothetical protein